MASRSPSVFTAAAAASVLIGLAAGQQVGLTPEDHPALTTYKCTTSGGCVAQDTSVVIDWGYHWIHETNSSTSCTTSSGSADPTLCPTEDACSANCVIEGANYTSSGVSTSGDSLTMYQYMPSASGAYQNASPRLYLLAPGGTDYEMLQLLGQEISFEVDLSTLPCGENGAFYLSQMDATGGRSADNPGAASFGSGYCDAQCPVEAWRNGTVNPSDTPYCCNEMDILEANAYASAFTPHPCTGGSDGNCDKNGCGFNPYAQGYHSYWGPGLELDTSQPFTITTQFVTSDGTTSGTLSKIVRTYSQGGQAVASAVTGGDAITESWCEANDGAAAQFGGLTTMGEALGEGMVLVFAIWNDPSAYMNWLDSGSAGPCSSTSGNPSTIESQDPTTHVIWSNIRWGDMGSTGNSGGGGGTSSSSSSSFSTSTKSATSTASTTTTTTTAPPVTTTPTGPTQTHWGQCGGSGYNGPTACATPYACETQNPYYAQCL